MVDNGKALVRNSTVGAVLGAAKVLIQIVALPIMASLLGPREFAVFALALPIVTLFLVLADAGVSGTLATEDEANELVWASAFWAMLGLCEILQIIFIIIGNVLAYISNEPELASLILLISFSLPLLGLTNVPSARLYRRGHIQFLSIADLFSSIFGAGIGILCAYLGFGTLSFGFQFISNMAMKSILVNIAGFKSPRLLFKLSAISMHLRTSFTLVFSRMTEFAGRTIENFFFQKIFGTVLLGNYNLSNQICRFATEAVGSPVWASLYAHSLHEKKENLSVLIKQTITMVSYIVIPIAAILAASSVDLFMQTFGPKWAASGWMVETLIVFYAINALFGLIGSSLTAVGAPSPILHSVLALYVCRIAAIIAGYQFGLFVSVLLVGSSNILFSSILIYAAKIRFGLNVRSLLISISKVLISGILMYSCCVLLQHILPNAIFYLGFNYFVSSVVYLVSACALGGKELAPVFVIMKAFKNKLI